MYRHSFRGLLYIGRWLTKCLRFDSQVNATPSYCIFSYLRKTVFRNFGCNISYLRKTVFRTYEKRFFVNTKKRFFVYEKVDDIPFSGMTHFDLAMYVRLLDTLGSRELYYEIAQF